MRFLIIITIILVTVIIYPVHKSFSLPLANDFYFNSHGDVILNQDNKTITANNKVFFINNSNNYAADNLTVWYQDLKTLDLEHINRIEANGNISITTGNKQKITGDRYVYSLTAGVHVLQSIKNPVIYKDTLRTLTAKDRIEYFIKENAVIIRGKPNIVGRANLTSKSYYRINADLINIKLSEATNSSNPTKDTSIIHNNANDVDFVEAVDNVTFKEKDTTISAGYAIYYKKQNQIEFYNNVIFSTKEGTLKGCSAIYNLNLGYGKLIPCSKESKLIGTYKPKQKVTK